MALDADPCIEQCYGVVSSMRARRRSSRNEQSQGRKHKPSHSSGLLSAAQHTQGRLGSCSTALALEPSPAFLSHRLGITCLLATNLSNPAQSAKCVSAVMCISWFFKKHSSIMMRQQPHVDINDEVLRVAERFPSINSYGPSARMRPAFLTFRSMPCTTCGSVPPRPAP